MTDNDPVDDTRSRESSSPEGSSLFGSSAHFEALRSPPSMILPHLYLGNQSNAANKTQLKSLGISRILSLKDNAFLGTDPEGFESLHVPLSDYGNSNILESLETCFVFIEASTEENKVLVHCRGGINRSPTVVLAYLMARMKYTLKDAYELVKTKRSIVCPHTDYMNQLRQYENALFGKITLSENEAEPTLKDRMKAWRDAKKVQSMPSSTLDISDSVEILRRSESDSAPILLAQVQKQEKSEKKTTEDSSPSPKPTSVPPKLGAFKNKGSFFGK